MNIRFLSEPHSFALLQWPALLALLSIDLPGLAGTAVQVVLGLWLLAMVVAAYARGRGLGFGNAMLLQCGFVAAAWWAHPSPWAFAWLAPIPPLMLVAQLLRLRAAG